MFNKIYNLGRPSYDLKDILNDKRNFFYSLYRFQFNSDIRLLFVMDNMLRIMLRIINNIYFLQLFIIHDVCINSYFISLHK